MRISQAGEVLGAALDADVPTMFWGGPGVGKSDLVHQVAAAREMEVRDIRISQLESVDLRGVPSVVDGRTYWNPPSFLPHDMHSRGILFLDEINSGSTSTMAAAYQLVLNKALGEYTVPPLWRIVAAGNRIQDRSIVNAMPAALRNRFIHIDVETHLDDWCAWALRNNIHSDVIAFLRQESNLLNEFDVGSNETRQREASQKMKDAKAFATPRSWAFLSKMLLVGIPAGAEYETYGSVVGEGVASRFIAYMKYSSKMPNLDDILMRPKLAEVPKEPGTLYATAAALATKLTENNLDRGIIYMDRMPPEFGVMCMSDGVTRNPKLCNTKAFMEWSTRNSDVIL
jgi:hypothetical protein